MNFPNMVSRGETPTKILKINDYIFGIYGGNSISSIKQIRYRKRDKKSKLGWTKIKFCKDIFWTIDILKKFDGDLSDIIKKLYNLSMTSIGKILLKVFLVNNTYILAVYQGRMSKYDLLIKYRQKEKGKWSKIRTPKHIHWAVDVLIKMNLDKDKTQSFLKFLIDYWDKNVLPLTSEEERNNLLSDDLLNEVNGEAYLYTELSNKGEYSIKFLLLIAKLLMFQEKTNLDRAYMFKDLLEALKDGQNIFKIISIATYTKR